MPIFFNLESHLWIGAVFVLNGLMLTWFLRAKFDSFRELTTPIESQILSAFFLSLSINGLILLLLDLLSFEFSHARWFLLLTVITLVYALYRSTFRVRFYSPFNFELHIARLALYLFVFAVLFYNGGLIEQTTDSWWHMSLINKIYLESTYSPNPGHLTGLPTRYYPPLWHGNIALIKQLSEIQIPVIWNSLTAWVGMFKVMAFYLFAYGLSKNKLLAFLAAVLFFLLPGIGASFMRVSAWPSHVAYTAWFLMFYTFALMFDDLPDKTKSLPQGVWSLISKASSKLVVLGILAILVLFIHKAEILWFAIAWLSYLMAASVSRVFSRNGEYIIERDHYLLSVFYRATLIVVIGYSLWFAVNQNAFMNISDESLAYLLPIILSILLLLLDVNYKAKAISFCLIFVFLALVLASIDYVHFYSLFVPELALPNGYAHESPAAAIGYLGGELDAPGWHLQLRSGLLYAGILSIIVAVVALVVKPSKISILLAGTSCLAILFCLSPYLYHWLKEILDYHSPWRVALIIFHPISWALALIAINDVRKKLSTVDE